MKSPRSTALPRLDRNGFTLVEVLVSLLVLVVAIGGTLGSISSVALLGDSNRDTTTAYVAAQRILERLITEDASEVFIRYNATAADDPAGGGPGSDFAVAGLDPQTGDPDGLVGRILFPVAPGTPGDLREDFVDAEFGMPRDLNADGAQDGLNHSTDYVVLPVRIRVEWRGRSGNRFIEIQTLLGAT